MNEFTQQQKDIPAYEAYRLATVELTEQDISLDEFTRVLKTDPRFKSLRYQAKKELKLIYDRVAKDLSLPNIPVFLPIRKKVSTRGQAHSICGSPTEIRVYPIEGVSGISRDEWKTEDIAVSSKEMAFEVLKHEIAHVIETHRNEVTGDHDALFVEAYDEINSYFKANGYENLIDPGLELWGCPPNSCAANARPSRIRKNLSQGCFTSLVAAALAIASLLFML